MLRIVAAGLDLPGEREKKEWRGVESDERMTDREKCGNPFSNYLITMPVTD